MPSSEFPEAVSPSTLMALALIPTPATPLKVVLRMMDRINLPLLVPEQFEIADHDYVVDIEPTKRMLDWTPRYNDERMMLEAYQQFLQASRA